MVEKAALNGNPERFALPRPMMGRPNADFSLSGLKTAVRIEAEKVAPLSQQDIADLCASFQAAIVDVIADRVRMALRSFTERLGRPNALVMAGGRGGRGVRELASTARTSVRRRASTRLG